MADVVVFGEALLRLSTQQGKLFAETTTLDYFIGGAELNVAVNMQTLGAKTEFVSVLPAGDIGDEVKTRIRNRGVGTSHIKRVAGAQGVYFLERAALPRPSRVLQRQAGAIASVREIGLNWREVLAGSKYFFVTGITAALSATCLAELKIALQTARKIGVKTAFDFNFRSKMWSPEDAKRAYQQITPEIDILFGSASDLKQFVGLDPEKDKLPWAQTVLSERTDASQYAVQAIVDGERVSSRAFGFQNIDRIGIGDAMSAGYLFADLQNFSLKKKADFAAACGAVKYSIEGDWNLASLSAIEQAMNAPSGGIIR